MLHLWFEDPDKNEDLYGITEEQLRRCRLDAIYDYSIKYGLKDVADLVEVYKKSGESPCDLLEKIGFTFDGKKLHEIEQADKIDRVPNSTNRSSLVRKRYGVLND